MAAQDAIALLDAIYLTLYFVRAVVASLPPAANAASNAHGRTDHPSPFRDADDDTHAAARSAPPPPSTAHNHSAASTEQMRARLAPLLVGGAPTLLRMLLASSVPLADRAAHILSLLTQLLAPARPADCCRALLVSGGAAGTLLALLDRTDRPSVQKRTMRALEWVHAADADELRAALAACPPELDEAISARIAEA